MKQNNATHNSFLIRLKWQNIIKIKFKINDIKKIQQAYVVKTSMNVLLPTYNAQNIIKYSVPAP